jgi:hypothetical protein
MARKRSRAAGDERAAAGDEQAGDERAAAGDEQAGDERAAAGDEQLDFQQEFEFMTGRPWPRNWTVAPAVAPAAAPMVKVEAGSPAAAPAAAPAAHEQVAAARVPHPCAHNAARPHPEYERLVRETPGTVIAQLMSGCLEELLDAFDIKRPTAGNEQEAMAMCAELEKLDVPTVCGVFENKTGYRFLDFTHGTTTTAQSERYSGFMKDLASPARGRLARLPRHLRRARRCDLISSLNGAKAYCVFRKMLSRQPGSRQLPPSRARDTGTRLHCF